MTKTGDRIELIHTDDTYTKLQPGDKGTVDFIDAMGTIHVKWDNGCTLGLIPNLDSWRKVQGKEGEGDKDREKGS